MDMSEREPNTRADTDHSLLSAWVGGDRDASEKLVRRHYRPLFLFFLNKVGADVAADLTQATFETLCSKKIDFRGDATVRTYLFGIARWTLVNHLRKVRGRPFDPMLESVELADVADSVDSLFVGRQRETLVVRALRALPLDDQLLLELKDYEGLTSRELAAIYEVPRNTMSGRVTPGARAARGSRARANAVRKARRIYAYRTRRVHGGNPREAGRATRATMNNRSAVSPRPDARAPSRRALPWPPRTPAGPREGDRGQRG